MVGIQLGEEVRVHGLVSNFLHCGHLVMILANGLIEVMGIQAQGNGAFSGGMYHGMHIMLELDLVFARESANAHELIWELPIKSSMDLMDLANAGTVAGLGVTAVGETGAGLGGFVPGCMTVTAQFIFTITSLLHDGGLGWQDQVCLQCTNMN